jgi:hypothetical protein
MRGWEGVLGVCGRRLDLNDGVCGVLDSGGLPVFTLLSNHPSIRKLFGTFIFKLQFFLRAVYCEL